jgi:meiotically up-regulated gene 157 (Mug157) protein
MLEILDMLVNTDGGTGYMHESFNVDDDKLFSRAWFAWSNSLFAEFVEKVVDLGLIG